MKDPLDIRNNRRGLGWIAVFLDPDPESFDGQACARLRESILRASAAAERPSIAATARTLGIGRDRLRRLLSALRLTPQDLRNYCAAMQNTS